MSKIIDRIQKLLKLAANAGNEHEAALECPTCQVGPGEKCRHANTRKVIGASHVARIKFERDTRYLPPDKSPRPCIEHGVTYCQACRREIA
jgi:hypothetical protein